MVLLVSRPAGLIKNILLVLIARRTWVGYIHDEHFEPERLPHIRKSILNPLDAYGEDHISEEIKQRLNFIYARDYSTNIDLNILIKGFRQLGRKS